MLWGCGLLLLFCYACCGRAGMMPFILLLMGFSCPLVAKSLFITLFSSKYLFLLDFYF
jgi:hypothetical protein